MIEIRRGMTVECIKACTHACNLLEMFDGKRPEIGRRYIVADFQNCKDGEPGIHLVEIKNPSCPCFGGPQPWPLLHFKPLIEDKAKTGAEIIEQMKRDAENLNPITPIKIKIAEKI